MSAARDYHLATNVPAGGTDEDESHPRDYAERPWPFKEYGEVERLPVETTSAGSLLQRGAGIVRSRTRGETTVHFRGYSSAGALYPVEAYVAAADGLYSFDALAPGLVRVRGGDVRREVADAARAEGDVFVVLTGIHARTGWKYLERGYRHVWWDAGTLLANLLALAAADELDPMLHVAFVDGALNDALGVDGRHEYALAVLALRHGVEELTARDVGETGLPPEEGVRYPLAERLHEASTLADAAAVDAWRSEPEGVEAPRPREELERAIRRRGSVREYSDARLPRDAVAELLAWSEEPIPSDAPRVVRQVVTVAAVEGLEPGVYDESLRLLRAVPEADLREQVGFAAMEQEHPRDAAVNVFQLTDLDAVLERLGDRGYRWAQLEAGIRAGRLQVGSFMRGWGAAASTFFDEEVSRLLDTGDVPLLMVALGPRV